MTDASCSCAGSRSSGAGPLTRPSLLMRIRSNQDDSWSLFLEVYGPLIYQYCRRRGLQDADAADIMQETLWQVSKSICSFDYEPARGRFRSWLKAVVHSKVCVFFAKSKSQLDRQSAHLDLPPSGPGMDHGEWHDLLQQQLLARAVAAVKPRCDETAWRAFQLLWHEGQSARSVAERFGKPLAWAYVTKSRIGARLEEEVKRLAADIP